MKDYFEYLIYCAFEVAMLYENKRNLTVEQLHDYRIKICEKDKEFYSEHYDGFEDEEYEKLLDFFHEVNANMSYEEEDKRFKQFLEQNGDFFIYENGVLYLRERISYDDVVDKRNNVSCINDKNDRLLCGVLLNVFDCIPCLEILGVTKIKEEVYELVKAEKVIESVYENYKDLESREEIKMLSAIVSLKLTQIGNKSEREMSGYTRVIRHIDDPAAEGDDFWLLSEHLMEHDDYYKLYQGYINSLLMNKYQKAIFDTGVLAYLQLDSYMDGIWAYRQPDTFPEVEILDFEAFAQRREEFQEKLETFEDEYDDNDKYEDDDEEEEMDQVEEYYHNKQITMSFYLSYIKFINDYCTKYGTSEILEKTKRRLLYLLDGYGDNLYQEENLIKALSSIKKRDLSKTDLDDYYVLSRLFLIDICEGWVDDNYTLRKVLFASAYYDLTKDRRIKRILDKYKKMEIGVKVYNAIIKCDFSGFDGQFNKGAVLIIK